ncbi:MAG: glycosyltransferase family 4 protein [Gemmatimonadota bacterium]|nr:glycosyltransferase family 4 protein [Gemmatimonadota bacterium]
MRPLRFCMITTFYPPYNFGGDGVGVQQLARALVKRGHGVSVICDIDAYQALAEHPIAPDAADRETADGVVVHRLQSRIGRMSLLLTQQTGMPVVHGSEIARLVDDGHFDVIHFHNISLIGGPGVLSVGTAIKLYTAQEHWLVCPTHVLWRHRREPCPARQCIRCQLRYHRPPQLWRLGGLLERQLSHVDAFIAMSEFSRAKHREFGFPRDMVVIPGFMPDAAPEEQAPPPSPHPRPYFLFVGRLERIKGLDDVIPAFAAYEDADLLIVGDGTHRATLEHLAEGNPRVRFVGHIPREQLDSYYRNALGLIVPSVGFETFGLVVIEAFHRGTPVIARRRGPLPELVELSQAGLLFDRGEELPGLLAALQRDPARRDAFVRAARAAIPAYWSEDVTLDRYLSLVEKSARIRGDQRVLRAFEARAAS